MKLRKDFTGMVVFGKGQELGIFHHEKIDTMLFALKPLLNVMRFVVRYLFSLLGVGIGIKGEILHKGLCNW